MDAVLELLTRGTGLTAWGFTGLCGVSFLGSFIAAAIGLGGGLLVLASMSLVLPPAALIPLHGVVQLGSNGFRMALMARDIVTSVVPPFLAGTLIGAIVGGHSVVALAPWVLQLVLGLFVLYATWTPGFRSRRPGAAKFFGVGAASGFLTMFVGGSGPMVAPFVSAACPERQQVVATHATLMTLQHAFKVLAFGLLGFGFAPYAPLLAGLLGFGAAGTWCGRKVLNRLPEHAFRVALRLVLSLLALRLLYEAARGFAD